MTEEESKAYQAFIDEFFEPASAQPPLVDVGNGSIIWAIQRALHFQRSQLALEPDVARIFREFLSDYRNRLPEALHVTASAPPDPSYVCVVQPHQDRLVIGGFYYHVDAIKRALGPERPPAPTKEV
jgi:hypothetical protein